MRAEQVIVTFGDSLTAGYGLPVEDGFTAQLQNWLNARNVDARIVNASVSGDTTAGGLQRIDWVIGPEVDGVILELGANDFLRGLPPETARENMTAIMAKFSEAGLPVLLSRVPAPGNYGTAYQSAFDAIYEDLAVAHDALLHPDFFAGLRGDRSQQAFRMFMQPDGLHPTAEGIARIVEEMGPLVLELVSRAAARETPS